MQHLHLEQNAMVEESGRLYHLQIAEDFFLYSYIKNVLLKEKNLVQTGGD